ncbi:MAG: hypothetical protein U0V03_09580 [Bacteroidia bacterium]
MQIERFLAVLNEVNAELNNPAVATSINELIALIPQASQIAQFDNHLKTLENHFNSSVVNSYPPSKIKILSGINGMGFCGNNAMKEILQIVQSNKFYNPADKVAELTNFNNRLNEFKSKITTEISSLTNLGLKPFILADNKFEVGVILSEHITKNEIKKIQEYLEEWHKLLKYLNEITSGNHDNPKISTLGTTDSLEIYFENTLDTASCVAIAIDRITTIYQNVGEGKRMLEEVKAKGFLTLDIEKNYEERKLQMIKEGLDSLVDEIAEKYKDKNEPGRINELKNGLRMSFEFIANSIDNGINVEVNTPKNNESPEQPAEGDSEEIKKSKEEKNKQIDERKKVLATIAESGSKTKLLPSVRETRILGLPEPDLNKLDQTAKKKAK